MGCDKFTEKTPLEHIDKAIEYREKGDFRASAIELKEALQQNPDLMLARQLLGETALEMGDGETAEKELIRALELGASKEAIFPSLAEAYQFQGKFQQILDLINASDIGDASIRAKLMAYRGDALLFMNKPKESRSEYEEALKVSPDSALAKMGLARLALSEREFDKALQLLDEAVQLAPKEARIYSLQGEVYSFKGENEKAEESFGKAIENRRLNRNDRAQRAILRIGMKKFDLAEQDINILKKESPNFFLTHYAEGILLYNQGKYPEAQVALESALKNNNRYELTYFYLGAANLQQNHLSQADDYLSHFLKANPQSLGARQLLAYAKIKKNDFQAAKNLLLPVLQFDKNNPTTQELLGIIELALGNQPLAVEHLKKLVELKPDSAVAHINLGRAMIADPRERQEGIKELEQAIQVDPKLPQADLMLFYTLLRSREFDKALEIAQNLHEKWPDIPFPLVMQAGVHFAKHNEAGAREALEKALKIAPGDPTASDNLASLEASKGDLQKATALYQEVLQHHPGHLDALLKLAQIKQYQGDMAGTKKLLEQAIEIHPEAIDPRAILADYYIGNGQPQQALSITQDLQKDQPNNPVLLRVIGEAQLKAGQATNSVITLEKLTTVLPKSPQAFYLLYNSYMLNKQPSKALDALNKVLALKPDHTEALIKKTELLLNEGKTHESEKLLENLNRTAPDNPEVIDLRAKFALAEKNPQKAIAIYEEGSKRYPDSNHWILNLAKYQWSIGEREKANAILEGWLSSHVDDHVVRFVLANNEIILNQADNAKANLVKLHEKFPKDVFVLNNLAWLNRGDNPKLALDYARNALELAPNNPTVMDTLGGLLLESGEIEEGVHYLGKAADSTPNDPSIQFHLAQGLARKGDTEGARGILSKIILEHGAFPERDKAKSLLNDLGG